MIIWCSLTGAADDPRVIVGLDLDWIFSSSKGTSEYFVMFKEIRMIDLCAFQSCGLIEDAWNFAGDAWFDLCD